jgi:hypothetical protein
MRQTTNKTYSGEDGLAVTADDALSGLLDVLSSVVATYR